MTQEQFDRLAYRLDSIDQDEGRLERIEVKLSALVDRISDLESTVRGLGHDVQDARRIAEDAEHEARRR